MRWSEGYRKLPYLLVLLAGAGLSISLYLAVTHYGKKPIACGGIGQCDYVNSSEYASVGGIPVSLLGVGLYAALIAKGELLAYETEQRFYEVGSLPGIEEFRRLVAQGAPA